VIPEDVRFHGVIRARHAMVIAGLPVAREVFRMVVPDASFRALIAEGDAVMSDAILAEIDGPARGLLTAERTALNLLQILAGIATATRQYVERIRGTGCTLLDTRKTIPGMRQLCKYATRCGGAQNHRMGLFDAILIKDNHIAVCGSISEAVARAKLAAQGKVTIEVECDALTQVAEAVEAGVDMVLLDNMSIDELRRAVALVDRRAKTEASGGVTLETIRAIAESGVDFVSVGRITQSAPAVDIGLDWS
jgi:nicotinate-nucleotide pyrophosphorylase (carboxylating)